MDRDRFDALTRLFAAPSSRRAALFVLLGAGLAGAVTDGEARKQKRSRHGASANRPQHKGGGRVSAQATCASPGPSSNLNGCNFNNQHLSGANLSSSLMRGTTFRGANLCGADLSSSQLREADFRGFASPGNATNLFRADLSSSGCAGTQFNARTLFCNTKTCNGSISNRDCPSGVDPTAVCCSDADCPGGVCRSGVCVCDVCASGCPYTSLAAAVAGTPAGGTISICPGVYDTRDVVIAKNLTIVGAGQGADPATNTILESNRFQRVLIIESGTVTVRDLRITKGHSDRNGGGIVNAGDLTLRNVTVIDNFADDHGGGIENTGALTLADGALVTENRVSFDGGGLINSAGTATLQAGSRVTRNTAGDRGGGVFEEAGTVNVADSAIVTGNTPTNCEPAGAVPNCIG